MDRAPFVVLGRLATLAGPQGPRVGPALRKLAVIDDGAMVVATGCIAWIGSSADLPLEFKSAEFIGLDGRLITPGLVDAHTHLVFGGNRVSEFASRSEGKSYEQIAAEGGGIRSTMRATRAATQEELVEIGLKHAGWMLANGTTTAEAKSGYGLTVDDELKLLRAIREVGKRSPLDVVPTLLAAHAIPPEFEGRPKVYVETIVRELLSQVTEEGLAEYVDAFLEAGYFDEELCRPMLQVAQGLGLRARLHADQLTLGGGALFAAEIEAATADHLEQTDSAGIAALARASVQPVLLPGSVYSLGKTKYPAAREMIQAELAVVLATDFNPGSSPVCSLPFVMSLACTQMGMTPEEALIACTVNAAHSLARGLDRGTLEEGKRADFVAWNCEDPREIAYWLGAPLVHRVWSEGRLAFSSAGP